MQAYVQNFIKLSAAVMSYRGDRETNKKIFAPMLKTMLSSLPRTVTTTTTTQQSGGRPCSLAAM